MLEPSEKIIVDEATHWFKQQGWTPFDFQVNAWKAHSQQKCGIINAPTGSGKTYSLLLPALLKSTLNKNRL